MLLCGLHNERVFLISKALIDGAYFSSLYGPCTVGQLKLVFVHRYTIACIFSSARLVLVQAIVISW